jgi:arylsulfatase A-like enzyme
MKMRPVTLGFTFRMRFAPLPLLLLAAAFPITTRGDGDGPGPNFVMLLSDDHGYLDSTPYGATDVRTPHMKRMAADGMRFTSCFVASPACAPSRSAMLTGLMPARNGAEANHMYKKDGVDSLPDRLRALGYQTAAFGKVAHNLKDAARHGFDHVDDSPSPDAVAAFLARRDRTRPLALFVGTRQPHVPWMENQGYDPSALKLPPDHVDTPETRAWRARYYSDVTDADTWLGALYDLTRRELGDDNTLFLYTSDHGAQWPFGKWNLYDAGIRSPLLVVWPGHVAPGSNSDAMVSWIDLLPTLIDLAGGEPPPPPRLDGRSFAPVLRGQTSEHRDLIFSTHSGDGRMNVYPIRSVRDRSWKYVRNLHPEFQHATHINRAQAGDGLAYWRSWEEKARTDPHAASLVRRYKQRPREELYNLENDPHELRNLADDPEQDARLARMRALLDTWMREQGDQETVFNEPLLIGEEAVPLPNNAVPAARKKAGRAP